MGGIALGIAMFLQVGTPSAAKDDTGTAVHVDCPPESPDEDCVADEVAVPTAPPVAPAAPAAVAAVAPVAPTPTTSATVSFRNDVGKKFRLVEARFTLDGQDLPVVLTTAEPGKSYIIVSGAMKSGRHVVTARLTYRGDRAVFSYMNGYKLNVSSDQMLTVPADRAANFTVVGRETKGMTVPLERRVVVTVEDSARRK
jgi:hypothetical protein